MKRYRKRKKGGATGQKIRGGVKEHKELAHRGPHQHLGLGRGQRARISRRADEMKR